MGVAQGLPALILLWFACVAGGTADRAAPPERVDTASDTADSCPGFPHVYFAWYPRDGLDILEVLIDQEGAFSLALSGGDWSGEDCLSGGACHAIHGNTLALQTVNSTSEVEIDASTWFTEARFQSWALVLAATEAAPEGAACVGDGYPGCCTRDSRP
jgi:hypothetical protein